MFRPVLWLLTLWLVALTAIPVSADQPFAVAFHDRIHSRITLADGSSLVVGDRGPVGGDCSEGARAVVSRLAVDGSVLWTRVAHAESAIDDGASPLFVGPGSANPATIFGSSARDVDFDADTDTLVVVGEIIQVYKSEQLEAHRRGFVLMLDIDGEVIIGGSIGSPFGEDPPIEVPTCEQICARLEASESDSWRPRAVAFAGSGNLIVTGARRRADGSGEAFLAKLTPQPQFDLLWLTALAAGEPGAGRDVLVDVSGDQLIYVTGTLGVMDRDVVVESYDGDGQLLHSVVSAGNLDDSGDEISFDEDRLVVTGRFNSRLSFGDQILNAGECERHFRAFFDRQLDLLEVYILTVSGMPIDSATESTSNDVKAPKLLGVRVVEGYWGGGGLCQLEASDDSYFSIAGEYVLDTQSDATFIASYEVHQLAPTITHLSFEFTSQYCTGLTISLGGGGSELFIPIMSGSLCPIGEPVLRVPVPTAVSHALGFGGGGTSAQQGLPLWVRFELSFYGYALCQQGLCASGAKDGSVDELELGSGTDQ